MSGAGNFVTVPLTFRVTHEWGPLIGVQCMFQLISVFNYLILIKLDFQLIDVINGNVPVSIFG